MHLDEGNQIYAKAASGENGREQNSSAVESSANAKKMKERKWCKMSNQSESFVESVRKIIQKLVQKIREFFSGVMDLVRRSPIYKSLMNVCTIRHRKKLFRDFFQEIPSVKVYRSQNYLRPITARARSRC